MPEAEQSNYQKYNPAEKTYIKGHIIQYDNILYKVISDFNSSVDFNSDIANLTQYFENSTITVNAFVNEDMIDARKNSLYVNINQSLDKSSISRTVDVRTMEDNLDYNKNAQGLKLYENILYNAVADGALLFLSLIHI